MHIFGILLTDLAQQAPLPDHIGSPQGLSKHSSATEAQEGGKTTVGGDAVLLKETTVMVLTGDRRKSHPCLFNVFLVTEVVPLPLSR